jgi:nuclear pore complex protein Nup133
VIVIPTTGKITYWESIASAATLNLKLQRNGVELTIPGMLSGEKVIQILNAESAGFMLAFSSGRIAYMTVRDGQGRPAITVQFLRSGNGTTNTGIFGSLRNALSSSSWHGDIAAIRAGPQKKIGERNVVVATRKGKLQSWNIHRGGHTSLIAESEAREKIVTEIKEAIPALTSLLIENFELLDVAYFHDSTTETSIARQGHVDTSVRLLLLVSLTEKHVSHYALVEAMLGSEGLQVGNIRQIKSYSTPIARDAISNTRLYLPDPSLAFIVFDRAVVVPGKF